MALERGSIMKQRRVCVLWSVAFVLAPCLSGDEITEWDRIAFLAAHTAGISPLVTTRANAIVQASIFDAVNGIERRHTAIHVPPAAPAGASPRAAAVQAAYASLVKLFPAQAESLTQSRASSLAAIASGPAMENSVSIRLGIEWGQRVADGIWDWRSGDGFNAVLPPFLGGTAAGQWRPTPPAQLPGAGLQFASMVPWVMHSSSQFRPAGPPALTSATYSADFNEVKTIGAVEGARTPDQTLYSLFWNSTSPSDWGRVALVLAEQRHLPFSEINRLMAEVALSMADAGIGCYEAKYAYTFWRPITAIRLAASDGNSATMEDAAWTPLLTTPPFPEYPSAHSCISGAAARTLAIYFGGNTAFSVDTDVSPGTHIVRHYDSFDAALEEVKNARIFGGIHFRTACDDGQVEQVHEVTSECGSTGAAYPSRARKGLLEGKP
jgi:hypothetical protein